MLGAKLCPAKINLLKSKPLLPCNMTASGEGGFTKVIKVKWGQTCWPQPNTINILITAGDYHTDKQRPRGDQVRKWASAGQGQRPQKKPSLLISCCWTSRTVRKCISVKPPSMWYFVTAAQADECSTRMLNSLHKWSQFIPVTAWWGRCWRDLHLTREETEAER